MSPYIFRRQSNTNKFWSFSLLAMLFLGPAIVLEHVEAEEPQPLLLILSNFPIRSDSLTTFPLLTGFLK